MKAKRCPVCGEPYFFCVPSRMAFFKQGEFFRCIYYGDVYFHEIEWYSEEESEPSASESSASGGITV